MLWKQGLVYYTKVTEIFCDRILIVTVNKHLNAKFLAWSYRMSKVVRSLMAGWNWWTMKRRIAGQLIWGGLELVPDWGLCRVTGHHPCLTSQALSTRRRSTQPDFDVYPAIPHFIRSNAFLYITYPRKAHLNRNRTFLEFGDKGHRREHFLPELKVTQVFLEEQKNLLFCTLDCLQFTACGKIGSLRMQFNILP